MEGDDLFRQMEEWRSGQEMKRRRLFKQGGPFGFCSPATYQLLTAKGKMDNKYYTRAIWFIYGAIAACLIVLWMLPTAEAQMTVRVRVYQANQNIEPGLLEQAHEIAAARLSSAAGIKLKTLWWKTVEDGAAHLNNLKDFGMHQPFYWWNSNYKITRRRSISLVYTNPLLDKGLEYFAGTSSGICNVVGGVAVTHSKNDLLKVALVSTHEVGHLVGAFHDDSLPATIMHPNAGGHLKSDPDPKFSDKSVLEIGDCVKKYRKFWRQKRRARR